MVHPNLGRALSAPDLEQILLDPELASEAAGDLAELLGLAQNENAAAVAAASNSLKLVAGT